MARCRKQHKQSVAATWFPGVVEWEVAWRLQVPEGGRLVVFLAGVVEHEVMPAYAPRVALTAWFS